MDANDDNSPQAINQTYKIWKKNVPFLYNVLQVYELPSCSQSVEWLNEKYILDSWQINNLVVGSNSITKNNISVIQVKLPTDDSLVDYTSYKELANPAINKNEEGTITKNTVGTLGQQYLNITKNFPQEGEIMKIRAYKGEQKSGDYLAASIGGESPSFFIYDLSQDPQMVDNNKIILDGHEAEGFGLDWHPFNQNMLVTGAFDRRVCIWNFKNIKQNVIKPEDTLKHASPVEDVKWCRQDPNIIGSACQDKSVNIWDIREKSIKPTISRQGHNGEVYTLDFNNFTQHLLLTGGEDSQIILWDTRDMSKYLHSFIGHNDLVSSVKWSTTNPYNFTSASFDRRTVVWDIREISNNRPEMIDEDQQNKEVKFIHGGHRSKILDFCWNQQGKVCTSVEQHNILHVWQMNEKFDKN